MRTILAAVAVAGVLAMGTLVGHGARAAGSAPSGTPSVVAYTQLTGGISHLWTMDLDTRAARRLTHGRYGEDSPSWSPDGRQLVYADSRVVRVPGVQAPQTAPVIVVRDMARGTVRAITNGSALDETPAWSPAGGGVAFVRTVIPTGNRSGPPEEIWTMRTDGRRARQLTHNSLSDIAPAWSPTGRRLAYQRAHGASATAWDLWTMRADGSGQRLLVRNGTRPAWSPDGRLIAYGRPTGEVRDCCAVTNLTLMDSDGSHRRLLVANGGRPAWSPDQSRIVFQRLNGTRFDLWIVNSDGSGLRRLTGRAGDEYAAAWRPA